MTTPMVPWLSAADSKAYVAALATDCRVALQVQQYDLSHKFMASVDTISIDGQLNILEDTGEQPTRSLQMGFLDPDHALQIDSDSPTQGVGGLDRLIRVVTQVYTPELDRFIPAVAFTGRPSRVGRDGNVVTIQAESKECLHLRGVPYFKLPKGMFVMAAIVYILRAGGETRFKIPPGLYKTRLASDFWVGGPDAGHQPWQVAWRLARSIGLQLYYDPAGWACVRYPPKVPSWSYVQGVNLLTRPKIDTDLTTIRNRVVVYGHTVPVKARKGHKAIESKLVSGSATAHWTHPWSPQKLIVNGKPWSNTEFFDEPNVHTVAQANAFAHARLLELLTEKADVQLSALPVWHVQSGDLQQSQSQNSVINFRLKEASIPFGPSESGMTVGYLANVRKPTAGRLRKRS